tara:strand:- start:1608 stop:3323 length:1716 start_codon:yes stop_codon:yes gene_type:complete
MPTAPEDAMAALQKIAACDTTDITSVREILQHTPASLFKLFTATGMAENCLDIEMPLLVRTGAPNAVESLTISRTQQNSNEFQQYQEVNMILDTNTDAGDFESTEHERTLMPQFVSERCRICRGVMSAFKMHECTFVSTCSVVTAAFDRWQRINAVQASRMKIVTNKETVQLFDRERDQDNSLPRSVASTLVGMGIDSSSVIKTEIGEYYKPHEKPKTRLLRVEYDLFYSAPEGGDVMPVVRISAVGPQECARAINNLIIMVKSLFPSTQECDFSEILHCIAADTFMLSRSCVQTFLRNFCQQTLRNLSVEHGLNYQMTAAFFETVFKELLFQNAVHNLLSMPSRDNRGCLPTNFWFLLDQLREQEILPLHGNNRCRNIYHAGAFVETVAGAFSFISREARPQSVQNIESALKSLSVASRLTSNVQLLPEEEQEYNSFLAVFSTLLRMCDVDQKREKKGGFLVINLKLLQAIDDVFWKVGSVHRTGLSHLCTISVNTVTRAERDQRHWQKVFSTLPHISKLKKTGKSAVEKELNEKWEHQDRLIAERHNLRLKRERMESLFLSTERKRPNF